MIDFTMQYIQEPLKYRKRLNLIVNRRRIIHRLCDSQRLETRVKVIVLCWLGPQALKSCVMRPLVPMIIKYFMECQPQQWMELPTN